MSLGGIPVTEMAATALAGLASFSFSFFLLRGRRRRRQAAEKRHHALEALAKERQRLALEWQKRDREMVRAAGIVSRPAAANEAFHDGDRDTAPEALASVPQLAPERAAALPLVVDVEEEDEPSTAEPPPIEVNSFGKEALPLTVLEDEALPSSVLEEETPPPSVLEEEAPPSSAPEEEAPPSSVLEEEAPSPGPAERKPEDRQERRVRFKVVWHGSIEREEWRPLLVYMYRGRDGLSGARADFRRRTGAPVEQQLELAGTARVKHATPITVIPELRGFRFDPPAVRVLWIERWHCVEFRMQRRATSTAQARTEPVRGRVAFFVGPVRIAETPIAVEVLPDGESEADAQPSREHSRLNGFSKEKSSSAYGTIFLSYTQEDPVIVREVEEAQRLLGDGHLRGVTILRSGEESNSGAISEIATADVFLLAWSRAAKNSRSVEREWRCALELERRGHIRPMYWERPMPEPPEELRHLRFTFIDMS